MVHEFGHFITAKMCGVKVLEFSIGMGPRILKFGKGETVYSLRILPVGGFCSMEGEDSDSEDSRSFRSQSVWKRMIVLFAGAFMNFVLGFVLVGIMTCMSDSVPSTTISGFSGVRNDDGTVEYMSGSYDAGLRSGDIIVKMDGMHVFSTTDLSYLLGSSTDGIHDFEVVRDGERITFDDVKCENGVSGSVIDFGVVYNDKTIGNVISYTAKDCIAIGRLVWLSLGDLISGKYSAEDMSGPVGVVTTIGETAQQSEDIAETISSLLYLSALITINVGIFNLLPIPGLDGGRLLFCIIEIIRRKPVKPEHEGLVHLAGMVLLFGLMIFVTYNDIIKLING
jgi:regulator of sigma E protease